MVQNKVKSLLGSARVKVAPQFNPVPIAQGHVTASSSLNGHPAIATVDGLSNVYWAAAAASNDGLGQQLTFSFDKPVNLDRLVLTSGVFDNFPSEPRPSEILLSYDNHQSDDLSVKNQREPQTLTLGHGHGVKSVQIIIKGVYPSALGGHSVAIGEIEFLTQQ
jgi:hypothetical protein